VKIIANALFVCRDRTGAAQKPAKQTEAERDAARPLGDLGLGELVLGDLGLVVVGVGKRHARYYRAHSDGASK